MPVVLRKRRAHVAPPPAPKKAKVAAKGPRAKKRAARVEEEDAPRKEETVEGDEAEAKEEAKPAKEDKENTAAAEKVAVGYVINLDGFGGEIQTNDGEKTTLKQLVEDSKSGVVLFTYPKASTPGCTNQACLFRDSYEPLTADGLAIYGLSTDSTKANTTFKEKQKLPYPLLCDPQATLIAAIGLRKQPKGTQRGVFVVNKGGKVLVAEPGGPAATVDSVKALVEQLKEGN